MHGVGVVCTGLVLAFGIDSLILRYLDLIWFLLGVLETQTVALATSFGELSPVLLVSPVKPVAVFNATRKK